MIDAMRGVSPRSMWAGVAISLSGAFLMTLAAKIQVPFWPVPMTLHTLAVMAFAVLLGPRLAASICMAYLMAGAAGLPVFSGSPERGIGLAYMTGPTGGYLVGFLLASWVVGTLARGRSRFGQSIAMLTGLAVIYAAGLAWLAVFAPGDKLLSLGLWPFLAGDLVKVAIVAAAAPVVHAAAMRRMERLS